MEILDAFDLTGTLRGAAGLAGCDHKTVAHWVRAREGAGGGLPVSVRAPARGRVRGEDRGWVERSRDKIRADVAHQRLVAMGYLGSERTTRRAVAEAKRRWRAEHGRRTRPWITEAGLWMQWDYGDGPARLVGAAARAGAAAAAPFPPSAASSPGSTRPRSACLRAPPPTDTGRPRSAHASGTGGGAEGSRSWCSAVKNARRHSSTDTNVASATAPSRM
jgi:hypothetical protein